MCVIGWSFRGVHGGVFMVCEMGGGCSLLSVALVCLLAVGVYLACGACGVHELACVCGLSACSSGVRVVSVCCVRVLRFVRVFVSLLVCEQGVA